MSKHLDFDAIKRALTIPEVLAHFEIPHTVTNNRISMVCPLPSHMHNSVNGGKQGQWQADFKPERGYWMWTCWGDCKQSGSSIRLIKELAQLREYRHVREWILKHYPHLTNGKPSNGEAENGNGTKKSREEVTDQSNSPQDVTETSVIVASDPALVNTKLTPRFNLQLDPDVPYLQRRGVTAETIERYGSGLCHRSRMFDGYVCVPIFRWPQASADERAIGYIGRWPGEDFDDAGRPRYKVGVDASQVVFGLKQALTATASNVPLILTEGIFSVFHLVQCGFPNTVSPLTASVSEEQARLLALTRRPICVLFDGDEAGRVGTRRAIAQLSLQTYARRVLLPDNVQPDDLLADELDVLLAFAKP